jgi:hypothetical protein
MASTAIPNDLRLSELRSAVAGLGWTVDEELFAQAGVDGWQHILRDARVGESDIRIVLRHF